MYCVLVIAWTLAGRPHVGSAVSRSSVMPSLFIMRSEASLPICAMLTIRSRPRSIRPKRRAARGGLGGEPLPPEGATEPPSDIHGWHHPRDQGLMFVIMCLTRRWAGDRLWLSSIVYRSLTEQRRNTVARYVALIGRSRQLVQGGATESGDHQRTGQVRSLISSLLHVRIPRSITGHSRAPSRAGDQHGQPCTVIRNPEKKYMRRCAALPWGRNWALKLRSTAEVCGGRGLAWRIS